jgi:serine/threonine protein kinase
VAVTDGTLTIGSVLAGYRLERKLGAGGMGAVYLARNPDLPRYDAVKVLSAELSRDPEFRARFIREADLAARLTHPNIVAVYRRGETPDGQLWIAMQFVDGTDADAAQRGGAMTAGRAVHIVGEVAKALDYAHDRHVLHRDLKPANFLLSGNGADERVLLADFGIARALDEVGLTATGAVMSTVAYAAPEVLAGSAVDDRADLYSLACSLFRLLTGKTPFWKESGVPAVMLAHLQQPPPRVTDLVPGLPRAFDEVIAVAMAKDPAQRYASAGEFASAAAAALHGHSETVQWQTRTAPNPSVAPAASPPQIPVPAVRIRPRRWRRALLAVFGVALLAAATVTVVSVTRSDPPPAAASTAPPPVPMGDVEALLPSSADLSAAVGTTVALQPVNKAMGIDSNSIDNAACAGAYMSAQRASYRGSGWQLLALQSANGPKAVAPPGALPPAPVLTLIGLVSFPVARLAPRYLDSQKALWERCAGTTVQLTVAGAQWPDKFGDFAVVDGNMFTISHDVPRLRYLCDRALTVRNNIAIDVAVCNSTTPTDAAVELAQQIAAKVPT